MPKDLAYEKELREPPQKSIRSGFFWLGTASILSQVLDASSMIIAMIFMTREELGTATLALSFCAIFEAFNSLGTDKAMLQDNALTRDETHSIFWFAAVFGLVLFCITLPLAWGVGAFYGNAMLVPLFIVAMLKLPFVCLGAVPLQLINRRLEYKKLGGLNAVQTILASIIKIVLAILGFGAWAFVIGTTAYGFMTFVGAFLLSHYRPELHFKWSECKRFIQYGFKQCIFNALDQFNKNLHYIIVGKILGEGVLGVYKISYELAMTPALALFNVVAKSSFPVFSRLQDKRDKLSSLFLWNQRNISIFAAIPTAFILFCAKDIFELFPNDSWLMATPVIPFVLMLSFVRSLTQTYPELYRACGRPEYPIYTCTLEAICVFVLCSAVLLFCPPSFALQGMVCTWVAILLGIWIIHFRLARHFIDVHFTDILSSIKHGLAIIAICALFSAPLLFFRDHLPYKSILHIVIEVILILTVVFIYSKFVLKISLKELSKQHKKRDV